MRIGIALGGGGAKGFAHIGVLQVLQEAGIVCSHISGTSIGALVGAVYANDNLERLISKSRQIKFFEIPMLLSPSWSFAGFFSGKAAVDLLKDFIDVSNIEELDKSFAAISADLETGEIVTFTDGNIQKAVRASFAIPLVFTPVIHQGAVLVDGGTLEPVPVQACRELGADFVIAVDLFGADGKKHEITREDRAEAPKGTFRTLETTLSYMKSLSKKISLRDLSDSDSNDVNQPNLYEMIERTLSLSQRQLTKLRFQDYPPDILIQPPASHLGVLDFHRGEEGIEVGRKAAEAALSDIKRKLSEH